MEYFQDCSDLIEEINMDLEKYGDGSALAILEMKPFQQKDGSWSIFHALVSYDGEVENLEELAGESCYQGCIFEEMRLSDILKIAHHQNQRIKNKAQVSHTHVD